MGLSANVKSWDKTQPMERRWWGNCVNTYDEEGKQQVYATKMGIRRFHCNGRYQFPMDGKSVVDIGGGPVSMLLKCTNVRGTVVDPFAYPAWVKARYLTAGIQLLNVKAEDLRETGWDEAWVYNLLEHVDDPAQVAANARRAGRVLRVFDWLGTQPQGPHRHTLTKDMLDELYHGCGTVEWLDEGECRGTAYHGVFTGDNQE